MLRAIRDNKKEVVITDEEVEKIQIKHIMNNMPNSLELYIYLSHLNKTIKGDFTIHLGPMYGSNTCGKSFGRFIDIMPEKTKENFIQLEREQKELYSEDTIVAEIVELPQLGRLSNVALNWNPREYELAISTNGSKGKNRINIKDLYIGIDNQRNKRIFYIKSKSLNKKIIFKSNNMLNIKYCSNIYRLLLEVSAMNERNILSNFYNTFSQSFTDMDYTPRIRYRKSIIYPATWRLNNGVLNLDRKKYSKEEFYKSINEWRKDWKVPKFVYLQEGDNRLLLNLENRLHIDELFYMLSKNNYNNIVITEIEGEIENRIANGEDGKYFSEIVVPLLKNKDNRGEDIEKKKLSPLVTKSEYLTRKSQLSSLDAARVFFPGDEWLSMKLYGNSKRKEELVCFYLMPFCQKLISKGEIEKFFFLRYADPERHLRLRMKGNTDNIQQKVIPKVNRWFKELAQEGMLNKAIIDTYSREVERYGGLELIELAEDIFYIDSIFACSLLNKLHKLNMPLEVYITASIINMMEELGVSYQVQKEIFISSFDKSTHRELFQKYRRKLLNMCNSYGDWKGLKEIEYGHALDSLFNLRQKSLNKFGNKMRELDNENKLWNNQVSIILSIIHMHCNRILGSKGKEHVVMATVRHTLYALEFVKKNQGKIIST